MDSYSALAGVGILIRKAQISRFSPQQKPLWVLGFLAVEYVIISNNLAEYN